MKFAVLKVRGTILRRTGGRINLNSKSYFGESQCSGESRLFGERPCLASVREHLLIMRFSTEESPDRVSSPLCAAKTYPRNLHTLASDAVHPHG